MDEFDSWIKNTLAHLLYLSSQISLLQGNDVNQLVYIRTQYQLVQNAFRWAALRIPAVSISGNNNVVLLGRTASGKSSLINAIFGKPLAITGYCDTTKLLTCYSGDEINFIDSPAITAQSDFLTLRNICFMKGLAHRIILVNHTLREVTDIIGLFNMLSLSYIIVVNKCDQVPTNEFEKFQLALCSEREQMCIASTRIFFLSCTKVSDFANDWIGFCHMMIAKEI